MKESWDADAHPRQSVEELVAAAVDSGRKTVVVTGGEPAMHNLAPLTDALRAAGLTAHIETSGAHPLTGTWDWVTLSPKKFKACREDVYPLADELKVVVFHRSDMDWAAEHAEHVRRTAASFCNLSGTGATTRRSGSCRGLRHARDGASACKPTNTSGFPDPGRRAQAWPNQSVPASPRRKMDSVSASREPSSGWWS